MITRIKLFLDFVKGTGFFLGDPDAWKIARKMSKYKRRNLVRRGIVPIDFFLYLEIKCIIKHSDIPEKAMTLREFVDFLWHRQYQSEEARAMGWYLYREILKSHLPSLAGSFAESSFVWTKIEDLQTFHSGKGRNRAMIT